MPWEQHPFWKPVPHLSQGAGLCQVGLELSVFFPTREKPESQGLFPGAKYVSSPFLFFFLIP